MADYSNTCYTFNMNVKQIARKGSSKAQMIYHENPKIFHVNTLENHCYFIPFGKNDSGKKQPDPFASREKSNRFELLNGKWGFRYYSSLIDLDDDFADQVFSDIHSSHPASARRSHPLVRYAGRC